MPDSVLFICPQEAHSIDTLYHGCLSVFGPNNIYDFPISNKNHREYRGHSNPYHWWYFNNNPNIVNNSKEQWIDRLNSGEIKYLIGSTRDLDLFTSFLQQLNEKCCVVLIEEASDPGFESHRNILERLRSYYYRVDLHYKVEYIAGGVGSYDKIKPFYMSAPLDKLLGEVGKIKPIEERKYDVCCLVGGTHFNRKIYVEQLENLEVGNNLISYGCSKYNLNQYFNFINDSKIFVSLRGNEWSNTRNVEGPVLGAALFTEKLDISIPFDYIDGKSAVFFNRDNLIPQIKAYLSSPEKLKSLAKESHKHGMEFHTTIARAKQMVALAKKIKGW